MANSTSQPNTDIGVFYPSNQLPRDFMESWDTLWLKVTAKEFTPSVVSRGGTNMGDYVPNSTYFFLMPPTFAYGYNHDWQDFNTIAGAAREVKAGISQQVAAVQQTAAESPVGAVFGEGNLAQKNDNAFIYLNTQRFTVQIQVSFAVYTDAKKDVFDPIRALMDFSSPEMKGGGALSTDIKFPYVFDVSTVSGMGMNTSQLLEMEDAALTSIMPTWNGPYIDGYPSSATCELTFTDIYPVYKNGLHMRRKIRAEEKKGKLK